MTTHLETQQSQQVLDEATCLYDTATIEATLNRMAQDITQQLHDKQPLCLTVMTGGLIFAGQLLTRLQFPLQLDYLHASRYRGETSGKTLHWLKEPALSLQDRTILILDDILDEGITLKEIVAYCHQAGAAQVYTAVLVLKELPQRAGLQQADFTGLTVPNRYVFGYGMDYKNQLRHVAGIYGVKGL